jgi:hypothetical protein
MLVICLCVLASACASTLVRSEQLVRDSIDASEKNRCAIHAMPCLSEDQFKAVNAGLYRAAVVGKHVTTLEAAHAAAPADYKALYDEIAKTITAVQATGQGGVIGDILAKLTKAQQYVADFLQKHGVS